MGDLAFQCPQCLKNLAVSDEYIGVMFSCPDCASELTAPMPDFVFPCPSCACHLFGPHRLRKQTYGCPNCETLFEVPENTTIRCGNCAIHLEVEDEYYAQLAGTDVECPQCGAQVGIPTLPTPEMAEPEAPEKNTVTVKCHGCYTDIELDPERVERMGGKLMRCPKCRRFTRIPKDAGKEKTRFDEPTARQTQSPKVMEPESGENAKTMRLDSILENIPQARLLEEGQCLYCNSPLTQINAHTFKCEFCRRVIRTVKRR